MQENKNKIFKLTITGVFAAIVVTLQCTLGLVTVGTVNLNFVLIPIVIGGIMYGPFVGTFTGLAFGITVFIQCITGTQGVFGSTLLELNWFYTLVLNVGRGALVGFLPCVIYKSLKNIKNDYIRLFITSACAPVINTGFFLIIYSLCFNGHLHELMNSTGATLMSFLFISLAGLNFVCEFASTVILTPPLAKTLMKAKKQEM